MCLATALAEALLEVLLPGQLEAEESSARVAASEVEAVQPVEAWGTVKLGL